MWWGMFIPCRVALGSTLAAILILGAACPWNSMSWEGSIVQVLSLLKQSLYHFTGHYAVVGRRQWHPTPLLFPGKSHGWRSLVGCSPWGLEESDTTERLHFHFSLSCIGEGNGNPLQCSCLENPWDGGAWWASIYGVAQSWTRLKRLSSSSMQLFGFVLTWCPQWCIKSFPFTMR